MDERVKRLVLEVLGNAHPMVICGARGVAEAIRAAGHTVGHWPVWECLAVLARDGEVIAHMPKDGGWVELAPTELDWDWALRYFYDNGSAATVNDPTSPNRSNRLAFGLPLAVGRNEGPMNKTNMAVVNVRVSDLVGASFNPACRTAPRALKSLLASIKERGVECPIFALRVKTKSGKHLVVDGHRRLACCHLLGIDIIPVIFKEEEDAVGLWGAICRTTRRVDTYEWLCAGIAEPAILKEASAGTRGIIAEAFRIFGGRDGVREYLVDTGTSPNVVRSINQVVMLFSHHPTLPQPDELTIGCWFIDHHMQNSVRKHLKVVEDKGEGRLPLLKKLAKNITTNTPFVGR